MGVEMSKRYSQTTKEGTVYDFWLIFEEAGGLRLTRTEPHLDRAERAMFVRASLPSSLWATPTLRATISVNPSQTGGFSVDLQVAADALRSALGVDIDVVQIEEPSP